MGKVLSKENRWHMLKKLKNMSVMLLLVSNRKQNWSKFVHSKGGRIICGPHQFDEQLERKDCTVYWVEPE